MRREHFAALPSTDYHRYRTSTFELQGEPYAVVTKPGLEHWDAPDAATQLLIEAMDVRPEDNVLDLGCGVGCVGLVAAGQASKGRITLLDRHVAAVSAVQQSLALNGMSNAEAHLSDCGASAQGQAFDVVAIHAPREKAVARQCVRDAAALLRPGGRCYLAGANHNGVKPVISYMGAVFGQAQVLGYKGGCRVALAVRGTEVQMDPVDSEDYYRFQELVALVRGKSYPCLTKPGIFSWDTVDEGTRRLVEHMEIRPKERVLDLGSGYGLAGLVAADLAMAGRVVLTEADCVAAEASRRTLARNGMAHTEVLLSDCGAALLRPAPGGRHVRAKGVARFDVVITNPPFHQGHGVSYDVARQFIHDAVALLRPGGRLYVVANRFIPYGREMAGLFQDVGVSYQDSRFQVWKAIKGRSSPGARNR